MAGTNLILVLVVLTNLKLLGSSRLGASIRVVAAQGVVLGLLPILAHWHGAVVAFAAAGGGHHRASKASCFRGFFSGPCAKRR